MGSNKQNYWKKNDKSSLIEYLKINDVREYNAQKISNSFAKYFAGIGKQFASKIPTPKNLPQTT